MDFKAIAAQLRILASELDAQSAGIASTTYADLERKDPFAMGGGYGRPTDEAARFRDAQVANQSNVSASRSGYSLGWTSGNPLFNRFLARTSYDFTIDVPQGYDRYIEFKLDADVAGGVPYFSVSVKLIEPSGTVLHEYNGPMSRGYSHYLTGPFVPGRHILRVACGVDTEMAVILQHA